MMTQDNQIHIRMTDEEYGLVLKKMQLAGAANMSAYIRKMAIDGYVLRLEIPELKEIAAMLGRISSNLNQVAKRANASGRIYETDLQDIQQRQQEIVGMVQEIYKGILKL